MIMSSKDIERSLELEGKKRVQRAKKMLKEVGSVESKRSLASKNYI